MAAKKTPAKRVAAAKNGPFDLERRLASLTPEAALESRPLFLKLSGFEIRNLDDLRPLAHALERGEMDWMGLQLARRGGALAQARVSAVGLRRELMAAARSLFCRELAESLTIGGDRSEANAAQARRNQLAHALEGALSEVRAASRFLFRGAPTGLAAMVSHDGAGKARKNRQAAAARPAPDPQG